MSYRPTPLPLRTEASGRAESFSKAALAFMRCGGSEREAVEHIKQHLGDDRGALQIIARTNVTQARLTTPAGVAAPSDVVDLLGPMSASGAVIARALQL